VSDLLIASTVMRIGDESPMSYEPNIQDPRAFKANYISTGIPGLDTVLKGGFLRGGFYLLQGGPGSGKTTVGLQYLLKRVQDGDRVLYIALTESRRDMEMICASHGWSLDMIELSDLVRGSLNPVEQTKRSIFDPSETELGDLIKTIISEIERVSPSHLVFDGLSELRMLAGSPLRYRRHLLSLKKFSEERGMTTLLLDDKISESDPHTHQSIVGATLVLEARLPLYGRARRRLYVGKVRSADFQEGFHDYEIRTGGLFIYPRLVSPAHPQLSQRGVRSCGIANLDKMFKGGIATGTSAVFIGPSGVGKSTIAMQFVANALKQGTKAAVYTFDEVLPTFLGRSEKLNFAGEREALRPYLEDGRLIARQVDPAELTPGAFAQGVRDAVEGGASIVVIDSLNGYINAMPEERALSAHLHELISYLNQRDVITIMVVAQHGILRGDIADFNVSYLADSVLLFRYFQPNGELVRGLRVLKNRTGAHEYTMRQFSFTDGGIIVGEPISHKMVASVIPYEDTTMPEFSPSESEFPNARGRSKDVSA
jgi:circadian clock protein KaiC